MSSRKASTYRKPLNSALIAESLIKEMNYDIIAAVEALAIIARDKGRYDLVVDISPDQTNITVIQDVSHGSARLRQREFEKEMETTAQSYIKETKEKVSEAAAVVQRMKRDFAANLSRARQREHKREREKEEKANYYQNGFPTSKYCGNYLLRRFTGKIPLEWQYNYYRYYDKKVKK